MSIFNGLTGEMSLTKTVVNELCPVGRTKDYIAEMIENINAFQAAENNAYTDKQLMFVKDRNTNEALKALKPIADDLFRSVINDGLSKSAEKLNIKSLVSLFELNQKAKPLENDDLDLLISIKSDLEEAIDRELKETRKFFSMEKINNLSKLSTLIEKAKKPPVWTLLKSLCIDENEFQNKLRIIERCKGNMSQLSNYQDIRDNAFNSKKRSASVSFRAIEVNLYRFYENIKQMNRIKEYYPELAAELQVYSELFEVENYPLYLTQDGIQHYNEQIGRRNDDTFAKGVNQIVNLFKQQHGQKGEQFPRFAKLYNQILFGSMNNRYEKPIDSDVALFEEISESIADFKALKTSQTINALFSEYVLMGNAERLFLKRNALNALSYAISGDFSFFENALEHYFLSCKTDKDRKNAEKEYKDTISVSALIQHVEAYKAEIQDGLERRSDIFSYFRLLSLDVDKAQRALLELLDEPRIDTDRQSPSPDLPEGGKGFQQIAIIKNYFDLIIEYRNSLMPFYLYVNGEAMQTSVEPLTDFYMQLDEQIDRFSIVLNTYNRSRNYLTKKPFSEKKLKLSFGNPTLLNGWARSKERDNWGIILRKDQLYYLGITRNNRIVNDLNNDDVDTENYYEKLQYNQISGAAKSLNKKFFSNSLIGYYSPSSRVLEIREKEEFRSDARNLTAVHEYIAFMQASIAKTEEYDIYNFSFSPSTAYDSMNQFYEDVDKQAYSLQYSKLDTNIVDRYVESGDLLLFQIYNKDFSPYSKGKKNLNTLYFLEVFSEHNLDTIKNSTNPFFKLCGECEVFLRLPSIQKKITHPANQAIVKKRPENKGEIVVFPYDIIKDKRYTEAKITLHVPIQINSRCINANKIGKKYFNQYIDTVLNCNDYKLIGIDRGEKNLLYYSVINQQGEIIEQGSLNNIEENGTKQFTTDYHELLDKREKERLLSRKSWASINDIKDLKNGYISQAVHKIASLMIEHDAIPIFEDLNQGFKNSRKKIEKAVYQKLEKALVSKLSYLVTDKKETNPEQPGSYAKGLQLCFPVTSDDDLQGQIGVVHYINAARTSKIDPLTGFTNLFGSLQFLNLKASKKLFAGFDGVRYNTEEDYFEFQFNYKNVAPQYRFDQSWLVCSHGDVRWYYSRKERKNLSFGVTEALKHAFDEQNIDYRAGEELLPKIKLVNDVGFYRTLQWCLDLLVRLRYSYVDQDGIHYDVILSPVAKDGRFFNSDMANPGEPVDADANGAYCIALKGLLKLKQYPSINDNNNKKPMEQWIDFMRLKPYQV